MRRIGFVSIFVALSATVTTSALADIDSATADCDEGWDLDSHPEAQTTPSSEFTEMESGEVVRHEATGLEWRRCPEGMEWDGETDDCTGDSDQMTWQEALKHADEIDDWRLPDINELSSIVEYCRNEPAINEKVFPNTPISGLDGDRYWSASPSSRVTQGTANQTWYVGFEDGERSADGRGMNNRLRLVREGEE